MNRLPDDRDGPAPREFRRFVELLMEDAPEGYTPWLFRCREESKAPATKFGSWKDDDSKLSIDEATEWLEEGGNVGIAGMPDDTLVNVDIDDDDETDPDSIKQTLRARSRSRYGRHAFYFEEDGKDIPNIPTDDKGEVRSKGQYVLAPGSYVPTHPDDVPEGQEAAAGYYTVEVERPANTISRDELPEVFQLQLKKSEVEESDPVDLDVPGGNGKSALFEVTAEEVVRKEGASTDPSDRWGSAFHGSTTGQNMSYSGQGRIHCWRHSVAHGGLQALVVLSDHHGDCRSVGTGHRNSNAGPSTIKGDDSAIWHAWTYAKKHGYIPKDDQVPYRAIKHICRERDLCPATELPDDYDPENGETIPDYAYDAAISSIRDYDGLEPGRKRTGEIDDDGPEPPDPEDSDSEDWWAYARQKYQDDGQLAGRKAATEALEKETDWMYVMDSDRLWVYDETRGYFDRWGMHAAKRYLERELDTLYSKHEANEILERLRTRNQTRRSKLNARTRDSPLLCVGNGVIDLETGELMDHSPRFKFTRGLEWDYTPENAKTEPILQFLDGVTKRECDRDTILDHLAHGLMPGHPYRAFIIMYGPGSNGKTRVGKLLRGFVGEENAASVELQAFTGDDQFATGGLPGAFVNVGDDISVGEIRDTSIIKSLTGDGTLRANEKHEKQYEFENEAAMYFSANEPPRIREKTAAISDRLYPIEMPYRFVDDPDPEATDPPEKRKIPGIANSLLRDDGAMRGLLALAVDHAQELIKNNGQYSMPETPPERRELYEAASDPIKRFALNHLEAGNEDDMILKKDAFNIYSEMCDRQGERAAAADTFKQVLNEMASLNIENTRTRALSGGDDREYAWKFVTFTGEAERFMTDREKARYTDTDGQETETQETGPEHARPLQRVANDPTGYATVTVEVLSVNKPDGENTPAMNGTVKDRTTAMDFVCWDAAPDLSSGDTLLVENAKVGEYDGNRQLRIEPEVTTVSPIQQGAAYTDYTDSGDNQQLTPTDGGVEIDELRGQIIEHLRLSAEAGEQITAASIAGKINEDPDQISETLERIAERMNVVTKTGEGGYEVL